LSNDLINFLNIFLKGHNNSNSDNNKTKEQLMTRREYVDPLGSDDEDSPSPPAMAAVQSQKDDRQTMIVGVVDPEAPGLIDLSPTKQDDSTKEVGMILLIYWSVAISIFNSCFDLFK